MLESPKNSTELTPEQEAQYAAYMEAHPDVVIPPEERVDCAPRVAELENELAKLEQVELLESLTSIATVSASELVLLIEFKKTGLDLATLLTTAELNENEASLITKREPVAQALRVIHEHLTFLADATNIAIDALDALKARYRALSRAVGIINSGVVDHTR